MLAHLPARHRPLAWLLAILALVAFYKVPMSLHFFTVLPDGGFYANVARHVRDGDGLVSDICLMNEGCPHLPHATGTYPLWPLLLGYGARVVPLATLSRWLPTAFYFATLLLAYAWAQALFPRPLFPRALPGFGAGHVLALMLGLDSELFRYTSSPYTEGLSFALVFAALVRFRGRLARPTWYGGAEVGLWLGLATLSRYQLVLMPVAALPVLLGATLLVVGHRRAYATMTATAALVCGGLLWLQYHRLSGFVVNLSLPMMFRWDQMRFSDAMSPIATLREVHGALPYVADRAAGLGVAFGTGKMSYWNQFYTYQYALLAAAPLAVGLAVRHRGRAGEAWQWLRRPEAVPHAFTAVFAAACLLSVHTMHMDGVVVAEWIFAARQALVCVFAFFFALMLLLRRGGFPWLGVGVFLLSSSTLLGVSALRAYVLPVEGATPPPASALARWLEAEEQTRGRLVVVDRRPQLIAADTPHVQYYWYERATPLSDVETMVTRFGADLVIVSDSEPARFVRSQAFLRDFVEKTKIGGSTVYEPSPELLARKQP